MRSCCSSSTVQQLRWWCTSSSADAPLRSPIYGLIFLFKWRQEKDDRQAEPPDQAPVYFARQVISA